MATTRSDIKYETLKKLMDDQDIRTQHKFQMIEAKPEDVVADNQEF